MNLQKKLIWTAMFSATLGLTACGGGSSTGDTESTVNTATVSGIVADGYLEGATVCLDLNANKQCDVDEPTATTDASGAYTIANATAEQIASAAILALVDEGVIDSDTGEAVAKAYTLSAPVGKPEFVSPITTLVQSKIELNPSMTDEQAEASVKNDLGIIDSASVDLYADFIAAGESGDENYLVLHQTAQVVARVLADFTETLNTTLADAGVVLTDEDIKEIQLIVVEAVTAQLPTIYAAATQQIEETGEVSTDVADTVSASVDDTVVAQMDEAEFEDAKDELESLAAASSMTAVEALEEGGAVFMTVDMDSDYSQSADGTYEETNEVRLDVMAMLQNEGSASFYQASVDPEGLVGLTDEAAIAERLRAEDPVDEIMSMPVTKNDDGSVSFSSPEGDQLQIHTVSSISLAGITMKLDDVMHDFEGEDDSTVTFNDGDVRYNFAYSETPTLHMGNLAEVADFAALCPTIEVESDSESGVESDRDNYACETVDDYQFWYYNEETQEEAQYTVSELAGDTTLIESAINSWYWYEEQLNFYIKDSATQTVAMCKFEMDDTGATATASSADGTMPCIDGTEMVLGSYSVGTLADGVTPYVAIPLGDYEDGKLEVRYDIYTTDGSTDYMLEDSLNLDDSIDTGVFKPFNYSATQRILAAMEELASSGGAEESGDGVESDGSSESSTGEPDSTEDGTGL